MKITVIGLGYVGTVAAACLSDAGHYVTGVDIDSDLIGTFQAGKAPFLSRDWRTCCKLPWGRDGCGLCIGMGSLGRWARWPWWRRALRRGRMEPPT